MEPSIHQTHIADLVKQKNMAVQAEARKLLASGFIALVGCTLANFAPFPLISLVLMTGGVGGIGWFARGLVNAKKIDTRFYG